jgi:hypothetical protein
MAAHFAVGHVVGHESGRNEVLDSIGNETATSIRDDSQVLSKTALTVDSSPGQEARFILHVAQDTIDEFLPGLLWLTLILSVTVLFTCGLVRCCALASRQWGLPEHWTRILRYAFGALLLFFGFTLAFGAVGVNFGQLFFGLSIITAGAILSASDEIKNLAAGARLASLRVLTGHHTVVISSYDLEGEIISLGAFTSELRPIVERSAADGQKERTYADETVIIDNRFILSGPLYVKWHDVRPSTRPARYTNSSVRDVEQTTSSSRSSYLQQQQRQQPQPESSRFNAATTQDASQKPVDVAKMRARQALLAQSGIGAAGQLKHRTQRALPTNFQY